MHARTKALRFDRKTVEKIYKRDGGCIFCRIGYEMPDSPQMYIFDVMHIVNRSQGGLGIEQNGVIGCRWHHNMMDNGNRGKRAEMLDYIRRYMKQIYPDWDEQKLYYKKGMQT